MKTIKENMTDFVLGIIMLLVGCYATFAKSVTKGKTLLDVDVPFSDARSFVRILGILLMVLSVYLILRAIGVFKRKDNDDLTFQKPEGIVLIGFGILITYLILLNVIGYTIPSILMIAGMTFLIMTKEKNLDLKDKKVVFKAVGISCAYSVVLVFVLSYAFKNWLHVVLPS